ncbi:unnamed protein product [Lampetra planeri]
MVQNKDMKIFWKKVKGHSKIPGQEKTGNDQADAIAKVGSLEGTPWKLEDQTDRDGQQESTNQDIAVIRLVTRSGKNPAEAGTRAQLNSAQPSEDLIRMQQEDETLKTLADHIQDPAGKPITTDNLNDNKELELLGLSRVQTALGARLKRLPISSAGGQDPLDSSTSAESVSLLPRESRFGDDAASELWAPPTDRVPNYDSVSTDIRTKFTATEERLIRMTRTAPSPHDHQASV